jgi:hypothetical protein
VFIDLIGVAAAYVPDNNKLDLVVSGDVETMKGEEGMPRDGPD